jgi:hypothetical protein
VRIESVGAPGVCYGKPMPRPIRPTPTVRGKDAERLLRDIRNPCNPEEAKRRVAAAKEARASMMAGPHSEDLPPEEAEIGLLPISSLCGRRSKSAEEAKALQIRHELSLSNEERVDLALRLGSRRYEKIS